MPVAKDSFVEEDVSAISIGFMLPVFGNQMLIFPESPKDFRVEADVPGFIEALQFLFASNPSFTFSDTGFEADLCEVDFGERTATSVLTINFPTRADKLGGVEWT